MNAVAELNDQFRRGDLTLGRYMVTPGFTDLSSDQQFQIIGLIQNFDSFNRDNDPWNEHNSGHVTLKEGEKVFWKIDYYDLSLNCHSEDPANPKVTRRILTLMRADEL